MAALVYPHWDRLKPIAVERGWATDDTSLEELAQNPQLHLFIMSKIEGHQSSLATFEKVKAIALLTEPFSIENGELTNTLKLKRKVIYDHYKEHIQQIYNE